MKATPTGSRKIHLDGSWAVNSPDGRKFSLEARPVGVPLGFGGIGVVVWLLGWLYHSVARRGWRVQVVESVPVRGRWLQWRPPLPMTWVSGEVATKAAALRELDRLAGLIEAGSWPKGESPASL